MKKKPSRAARPNKAAKTKSSEAERKEESPTAEMGAAAETAAEAVPRTLGPVVPANRLKDGPSRTFVGPYGHWTDTCFESVIDRLRLAANVRAVKFPLSSSSTEEVLFQHDAGEEPIAVVLSALSIPAGMTEDIKIEPKVKDGSIVKMTVYPPNKGIGVGVTLIFQSAGIGADA